MFKAPKNPRKLLRSGFRIFFIIAGLGVTYQISYLMENSCFDESFHMLIILILLSLLEFILADIITDSIYPPKTEKILNRLKAKIEVVEPAIKERLNMIIKSFNNCQQDFISSVFLLKIDLYDEVFEEHQDALLQITDYLGPHQGKRWRFFPIYKGIVGQAYRTQEHASVNFADIEEYNDKMVIEFGYSKTEINSHNKDAKSYYAHPVKHNNDVVGILYFFTKEHNTFPRVIDEHKISAKGQEIASFLQGADIIK